MEVTVPNIGNLERTSVENMIEYLRWGVSGSLVIETQLIPHEFFSSQICSKLELKLQQKYLSTDSSCYTLY